MNELLPRQPEAPWYLYVVMRDDGKYMAGMPYRYRTKLFEGVWKDKIKDGKIYRKHGTAQGQATKCKKLGIEARVISVTLNY